MPSHHTTPTDETRPSVPKALRLFDSLPNSAFVKQPVVEALFSISPVTVWRWVNQKRLPMPKRHGARHVAWNVGELRKVLKGEQGGKV